MAPAPNAINIATVPNTLDKLFTRKRSCAYVKLFKPVSLRFIPFNFHHKNGSNELKIKYVPSVVTIVAIMKPSSANILYLP